MFFWRHCLSFVVFGICWMSKKHLFLFTSMKSPSNYSTLKTHISPNQQIVVIFFFKWSKYNFDMCVKKNNKTFCQKKSVSVFGGAHGRSLNTLKLCLAKCFIIFFTSLWKIHLPPFQGWFHKNMLVLTNNGFSHYNTF